ncbi:MAG: alpha/beta hydrolase [Bacteroidota bacterium]
MKNLTYTFILCGFTLWACTAGQEKQEALASEGYSGEQSLSSNFDQGMIHLTQCGEGDTTCGEGDTTLFFVHGWGIDADYWAEQQTFFCPDYRVVSMDMMGFGKSGKEREAYSIEAYAADVNTLIEKLELSKVVLIGHSMGGDVVLEAALNQPKVIAVVGVDNFKEVGQVADEQMQAEIDGFMGMLTENYQEVVSQYAQAYLFDASTDSTIVNRVTTSLLESDEAVAISSIGHYFEYSQNEAVKLRELDRKLFLINSENYPTDTLGLKNSGVEFEVISIGLTGHYPMNEKPDEFNGLLGKVLGKLGE